MAESLDVAVSVILLPRQTAVGDNVAVTTGGTVTVTEAVTAVTVQVPLTAVNEYTPEVVDANEPGLKVVLL